MSDPIEIPAEDAAGIPLPEAQEDTPEQPWFERNGEKYFGPEKGDKPEAKPRGKDGKFQKASKAKAAAKPAPVAEAEPEAEAAPEAEDKDEKPEPAKDEKAQRIGDAWNEVKALKRDYVAKSQEAERLISEARRAREEAESDRAAMRKDLRGWLQKQGLSFRQIVEEDLKEQDADPRERELRELRDEVRRLAEEAEGRRKRETERSAEQVTSDEISQLGTTIESNSHEFPMLSAYGTAQAAKEIHAAWYHHLRETGEQLDVWAMFAQAEQILSDQAERLAAAKRGNGTQAAEEPATAASAKPRYGKRVAEEPGEQAEPATLTNRTVAQRASSGRPMSREERIAAASRHLRTL